MIEKNEHENPAEQPEHGGRQPEGTPVQSDKPAQASGAERLPPEQAAAGAPQAEAAGTALPPQNPLPQNNPPQGGQWQQNNPPPYRPGKKSDFHRSFWLVMLAPWAVWLLMSYLNSIYLLDWIGGYNGLLYRVHTLIKQALPIVLVSLAIVLRFVLVKKNYYLAKGFLWGAIMAIAVPVVLLLLLYGSCMLLMIGW